MWAGVCLAILLKYGAPALAGWDVSTCQKARTCDQDECNNCILKDVNVSFNRTGNANEYQAAIWTPHKGCRVKKLEINIYKYDYPESKCNVMVWMKTERELYEQWQYNCDDDEILSSEDVGHEINPKINLKRFVRIHSDGCYGLIYRLYSKGSDVNSLHSVSAKGLFYIKNNGRNKTFPELTREIKFLSDSVGADRPITLKVPFELSHEDVDIYVVNKNDEKVALTANCNLETTFEGTDIVCPLPKDLSPGRYQFLYEAHFAWCRDDIEDRNCLLSWNVSILAPNTSKEYLIQPPSENYLAPIIVSAVLVLVLLLGVIAYYYFVKRNMLREQEKKLLQRLNGCVLEEARVKDDLKAIVLVYARDCELFMHAVSELKFLLEQRCQVKVYDIFDPATFNEISANPYDWVAGILQSPGVKFVLLKTRCGELLYEPIIVGDTSGMHLEQPLLPSRTHYRTQRTSDDCVHTLFRLVRNNAVLAGSYVKYYVVQIPNFSGDKQFYFVNSFRRYDLPANVNLLVSDLVNCQPGGYERGLPEERLETAIERLMEFVHGNPDYIISLLQDN